MWMVGALAAQVAITAEAGKGITVAAADGSTSLNLIGRVMPRETLSADGGRYTNEINIRTARLNFTGNVFSPEWRFQLQLAFAGNDFERDTGSRSPVLDAWIEYAAFRDLAIRVGQAYVQLDRARTTREFALQLVDRQIAVNELSLDRDIGVYLWSGDFLGTGMFSYALGLFAGEGRNRVVAARPGFLYVGRISFRPFGQFDDDSEGDLERLDRVRLAIGAAGGFNHRTDRPRSTTGVPYTTGTTFDYFHAAGDIVFKYFGFSFFVEVLYRDSEIDSKQTVDSMGTAIVEWSRSAWGYFLQAGMMLTDIFELAARWGELRSVGATDPALIEMIRDEGRELGGGVNAYLNGHRLKLQLDFFHLFGESIGNGRDVARLQLNVLF